MFREWSMLFRSQTAPATMILLMTCFLLGGGKLFSLFGMALFIFVILLHWFIFGNNSLMDSCMIPEIGKQSYDAQDKWKSHHPLITGKISFATAHKVIYTGLLILFFCAILFSFYGMGNTAMSLAFFLIFMGTGFAYNCGLSKVTILKFIPISICFTALGGYAYFIMASDLTMLFIFVLCYIFLTEVFEISVEGEQKEVDAKEANLLWFLGTRVSNNKIYMSLSSKIWGWGTKILNLIFGFAIVLSVFNMTFRIDIVSLVLFVLLTSLAIYFATEILHNKIWGRKIKLKYYGLEEICTIYILPTALMPIIGFWEAIFLMAFGIAYFITFNRINWGTTFAPRV